ncbi:unnamed protein product [Aspergillus oryzae]|uniref:Unnamed protein product n=2 Tax=Aspergillus oryzae TaxID=5062 RepID=A0AAN4YXJ2_ASPOZ|nr:unnamed protein product [Aspergillus oryzae]GMF85294.1 unnamed protein product [Aspergillus oryzae]GMG04358.1 unnamed protein product [Aspergillus oryzae]GMG36129.1 unnamed protein product [Aspergillus oryzae]GMG42929.1 unnamed protein product [Aspergillus oryzae var. brunneus]
MVAEGHTVASLTGGIEGSQRDAVIDQFRAGQAKVLITTNVLARGIDVSTVSMVINYVSRNEDTLPPLIEINTNLVPRTSQSFINPARRNARRTSRPTCTVSVVPDVSAVWVSPSRSSPTGKSGICSTKSNSTLTALSSGWIRRTGTKLRISSKRLSRTPAPRPSSGGEVTAFMLM